MLFSFIKMNGAGNDFVVFDARRKPVPLTPELVRAVASRQNASTLGCDQLVVMEALDGADVLMRIFNADGGQAESCGNAARCVAWLLMEESGQDRVVVRTAAGRLRCERAGERLVTVDMGPPRLANEDIPLAKAIDRRHVPVHEGPFVEGIAVGMGNPHLVFFTSDIGELSQALGERIECRTDLFPARVNVSAARIVDSTHVTLRVWERGAGFTKACGTAACATLAAAAETGRTGRRASVVMPGGTLVIDWREDGRIWMTGPVEEEFIGEMAL